MQRALLAGFLLAVAAQAAGQSTLEEQRRLDAERRTLEAERRAVEAEKREVEAERRANQASQGASRQPGTSQGGAQPACQAATASYQINCSRPSGDPLWDTPQCADARKLMLEKCG